MTDRPDARVLQGDPYFTDDIVARLRERGTVIVAHETWADLAAGAHETPESLVLRSIPEEPPAQAWAELDALAQGAPTPAGPPIVLAVLHGALETALSELASRPYPQHVVSALDPWALVEISVTLAKYGCRRAAFGVDPYLGGPLCADLLEFGASVDKPPMLDAVRAHFSSLHVQPRRVADLVTVADELVMNALYDAPTDAAGNRRHQSQVRTDPVTLGPGERVTLSFGADERFLFCAVTDPFGSLRRDEVLERLLNGYSRDGTAVRTAPGGAGVGLFMVFSACAKLVVNVAPGTRTEVIALTLREASKRRTRRVPKSLHFFTWPDVRVGSPTSDSSDRSS